MRNVTGELRAWSVLRRTLDILDPDIEERIGKHGSEFRSHPLPVIDRKNGNNGLSHKAERVLRCRKEWPKNCQDAWGKSCHASICGVLAEADI